jgi:ABC-type uncharacterized transport system substrate-binding protein
MKTGNRHAATASVFGLGLFALLFVLCLPAEAQQPKAVPRIGFLAATSVTRSGAALLLPPEFRKLGYVEGQNIAFEYRYADNRHDRLPALADELVRLKVDVLVAASTTAALAAKSATRTIPVVFSLRVIRLPLDWSTAWRGREETSPASPA